MHFSGDSTTVKIVALPYNSSFMITKKLHVFGWPAWLTSGFSGNLALFKCSIGAYCHIHCHYCLSQINIFFCMQCIYCKAVVDDQLHYYNYNSI